MNKEGLGLVIPAFIFSLMFFFSFFLLGALLLLIGGVLFLIMTIFLVFFFRDPKRKIPQGDDLILSPADGKVFSIEPFYYHPFFDSGGKRLSIFLRITDVHINRAPVSGTVKCLRYIPGRFYPAFKSESSEGNEQNEIWLENDRGKIVLKQVAGFLARRVVCNLKKGEKIEMGEKFGMIKFGSKVELLLPKEVEILVSLKEKVKAGETLIAKF